LHQLAAVLGADQHYRHRHLLVLILELEGYLALGPSS